MDVIATAHERTLELKLHGELDHHGACGLLAKLEREIDTVLPSELVLDFRGVTFMDSAGIAVALRGWQRMRELSGIIVLRGVSKQARKVLETAGVGRMMSIE